MTSSSPAVRKSALERVLDFVGSVPFGITMMVLILAWCWIGSAGAAPFADWFVRQTFEKTEMEWFTWWPFNLMMVLLALSISIVTVRRIPFNLPNLGVWVIHSGVVVLVIGGFVYFGLKIEGDIAVFRRAAVLRAGGGEPARLTLQPGAITHVSGPAGTYDVRVVDLNPTYELLTGTDKGKKTFSAQLMIEPRGGQAFIRQLLAGYPEYTEDVVPGQGRAIKVIGRKLVDENFRAELDFAPSDRLFIEGRRALHVRFSGERDWSELPLSGLPRYREHLSGPNEAWIRPGDKAPPIRQLSIRPAESIDRPEFKDVTFRVTGYLPFATLQESWEPGGEGLNPYLAFTAQAGQSTMSGELLAGDPTRTSTTLFDGVDVTFRWLNDAAELDALRSPQPPRVVVRVPARGIAHEIALADLMARDVPVPGTPYRVHGTQYYPTWTLPDGKASSMVLVRVTGEGKPFLRAIVSPQAEQTHDLDDAGQPLGRSAAPGLGIELKNAVAPGLVLVAGAAGMHALLVNQGGQALHQPFEIGRAVTFLDGALSVRVDRVERSVVRSERPVIIPASERDAKAGLSYSVIKVEAQRGDVKRDVWLEYSHYNYPTRVGYFPKRVRIAGLPPIELVYSRPTLRLPAPVALDEFQLEVFPGGTRERDYISLVRFHENGEWTEPTAVHSNNPTEHEGWWYFQSTWDPPEPGARYAGMNYTGLGVGNRHGVGILLAGGLMTVLGTLWAFYVKPVILRRRVRSILAARETAAAQAAVATVTPAPAEAVGAGGGTR